MLTPAFEITQDDEFLSFFIKAPYAKVSDSEIFVEGNEFKFFSSPYFLRLNLSGHLIEDGRETAKYDTDKGQFIIKIPKKTKGEVFDGLDMLTKLLAPKGEKSATQPLIEVLGSSAKCSPGEILGEDDIDWYIEQKPFQESSVNLSAFHYGFACQKSGVFDRLQGELKHLVDVTDPDNTSPIERATQRHQQEENKFDDDHYLADLYQDDFIKDLIAYKPIIPNRDPSMMEGDYRVPFTEEEKEIMRKLPRKEYVIDKDVLASVYLGLVDILYAYCYDLRVTEGEHNVESGWNICKLSSTLSWFECGSSVRGVLSTSIRRTLCFPLHRHWMLAVKVLEDVQILLDGGRNTVLKSFLDVHQLFHDCDSRYILNDLYITDYCVWIQSASDSHLKSLSQAIKALDIKKSDIGFNLEELEMAAKSVLDDDIAEHLEKLTVVDSDDDDDEDESSESSETDSSSSDDDDEEEEDESTDTASESETLETTVENQRNIVNNSCTSNQGVNLDVNQDVNKDCSV